MRALVTGDRGFLGRHFSAELKRRGYDVLGLDVKATSAQDCRDYFQHQIRNLGNPYRPHFDLVVHCAAVVGGRETIENDPLATAESLSIDAEMFRWAAVARPGRVIYFSSSAAYPVAYQAPDGGQVAMSEEMIDSPRVTWEPDEVYGWSKVTGELLADRLRKTGVPVTVVRPFSGYGEDQDPSYPFRAILDRVKAGEDPVTVWCGDCVRDWIHVDDIVAGTLAVAEDGTEAPVNLCTGEPTPFSTLVRMMIRETVLLRPRTYLGGLPGVLFMPEMPQGVAYRVGDPDRMLTIYAPTVTLEEGIRRALEL
jgi:nucleoside-diphosphate-sugar epimerase